MVFAARMRLQPCRSHRKPRQPGPVCISLALGAFSGLCAEWRTDERRPGSLPWIFERAVRARLGCMWRMRGDCSTRQAITIAPRSIAALIDINLLDDALNKLAEAC